MSTNNTLERPQSGARTSSFELQDKVVLLLLTLRAPGNERTVRDKSILSTNADHDRLHIGKRLLKCEQYRAITVLDGQARDFVARIALPTPFKAGTHVIPIDLLTYVDNALANFARVRRDLIEQFKDEIGQAKADARRELGELFREEEYRSFDDLDSAYRMEWQYVTLVAPDRLKGLSNEIFERERERLQAQWDGAIGDMRDALRVGLSELVSDMTARLSDDKKFKPTALLARFDEFLTTFDARNVTNDEELAALAQTCRALLAGVDTEKLTKSAEVRADIRAGFQQASLALTELEVVGKRQRRISFEDE